MKLKIIADIGLIGMPNAGKSTFLTAVTKARPKIADYPFTTLHPNLGVAWVDGYEMVLADIPGLIEGAHEGIGLGDRFLKHIERCGAFLHLIDVTDDNMVKNYKAIRKELELYDKSLIEKPEVVALNKCDSITDAEIAKRVAKLEKACGKKVFAISAVAKKGLFECLLELNKYIKRERKKTDVNNEQEKPVETHEWSPL